MNIHFHFDDRVYVNLQAKKILRNKLEPAERSKKTMEEAFKQLKREIWGQDSRISGHYFCSGPIYVYLLGSAMSTYIWNFFQVSVYNFLFKIFYFLME